MHEQDRCICSLKLWPLIIDEGEILAPFSAYIRYFTKRAMVKSLGSTGTIGSVHIDVAISAVFSEVIQPSEALRMMCSYNNKACTMQRELLDIFLSRAAALPEHSLSCRSSNECKT